MVAGSKRRLGTIALIGLWFCSCSSPSPRQASPSAEPAPANPFFTAWNTPFGLPPFAEIHNQHYLPALDRAIAERRQAIAAITSNPAAPTFANTIAAWEQSGDLLDRVRAFFYEQHGANTNDELEQIAEQFSARLTRHQDEVRQDEALFARVRTLHAQRDSLDLDAEQKTLLEESYKNAVAGGANLDRAGKAALRDIHAQLAQLSLRFGHNLLAENNRFELVLADPAELAGLPARVVAAAATAASDRGHPGKWVFTLHKPSLIPFLQYSDRRELRRRMFEGYISRGDHDDDLDNKQLIVKIAALRLAKARLLGHKSYAELVLERRMAEKPAHVHALLDQLWQAILPVARTEAAALQQLIDASGASFALAPWDWWYYAEKLRKARYNIDDEALRPYFAVDNVLAGAFAVASKLYGIRFVERPELPTYHPDVRTFEVTEADGRHLGIFFADYFPRAGKRGGAWSGAYRSQFKRSGQRVSPVVVNVASVSAPSGDTPALLSLDEVITIFHELGHGLHSLLADVSYARSHSVKRDFVELPSQIMENWALEPTVLASYARHYETGAPLPGEMIEQLMRARNFNQGFASVEYLAACYLDLDWHTLTAMDEIDVRAFETRSMARLDMPTQIVSRYKSPFFAHVFAGEYYSAGYYAYVWAEVLSADAFAAFTETSLFDQATARSFRANILSRGGAEDPMTLYRRFRGAEPKIEPLLEQKGLLAEP